MDISNHPADLTEPVSSLEGPGPKIKTDLTNDFLAHEREGFKKNKPPNETANNVDITENLKTTDNDNSMSIPEDADSINTTKNTESIKQNENVEPVKTNDETVTIKNENSENIDRIENITVKTDKEESAEETKEVEGEKEEWLDILGSGQLKKKILKQAENSYRPQRSNLVEINIEGRLPDDTIIDKHDNLKLQIGDVEHIQALDLALPLMDVGEVALLDVSPRFAYGNEGRKPDVPPDTRIMYKIELLSAEDEPDVESLPIEKRKDVGCFKRERGNYWYSRQEYSLAIQCYRRALDFLDDIEGGITLPTTDSDENNEDDKLKDLLEERLKVFNNLAAAQMKIKAFETALKSVETVLRSQPKNVKALYRKAKILAEKGEYSKAVDSLKEALGIEPDNKMIKQELLTMLSLHREHTKNEKDLYKKMFRQDKQSEEIPPKSNKFQFPWIVLGTLAALVAGVVAYRYKYI